jgi:hypothetical protein
LKRKEEAIQKCKKLFHLTTSFVSFKLGDHIFSLLFYS